MKGHFFLISLLPIPENLGLEKLCHHDSLWHFTLFLLRFGINLKELHIVCIPLPFCWGFEPPSKFSKRRRGLDRTSTFIWEFLGKKGWLFSGGIAIFTKKINYNLKYLTMKKVYKEKYFSLFGGSLKNPTLRGVREKPIGGGLSKRVGGSDSLSI